MFIKKYNSLLICVITCSACLLLSSYVSAYFVCGESGTNSYSTLADCQSTGCENCREIAGSTTNSGSVKLDNPIATSDPNVLIGKVINTVLGIVGSLALVMFIYGGFTWMLSSGSSEKVQKGKNILIWATIGLIVIFSAYALVSLVFTGLTPTP